MALRPGMDLRHTDVVKSVDRTSTLPVAGSGGDARGASGASDATFAACPGVAAPGHVPAGDERTAATHRSDLPDIPAVPVSGTAGAVTYLGSERGTRARIA